MTSQSSEERLRRWRLILGGEQADGTGCPLSGSDQGMDRALAALYNAERGTGPGDSMPFVSRWLGDIRTYFPQSVVQVMQRDALEKLDLKQLLAEPELLDYITPDVHLVATLLSLKNVLPATSRETARLIIRQVVEDLERRLREPLCRVVQGSLDRSSRTNRPRHNEIDWNRTIRANLRYYQPEYHTIIPERRIGYARRRGSALRDVMLCIDQSGSMATSVVYAGIFGAALASIKSLRTHVVVYDTAVVDLTAELDDPVDMLFGTQLGGGNDTPRALAYCTSLVQHPQDTILVLMSDLYEGAGSDEMIKRAQALVNMGVQMIVLLALNDDGAPSYDRANAARFAEMNVPAFACTPDRFGDLMAAAIQRQDLSAWASTEKIAVAR